MAKAYVKTFKNLTSFFEYWDSKTPQVTGEYLTNIEGHIRQTEEMLANGQNDDYNKSWFGLPVPLSYQDAMDRREFGNLTLYNNVYEEIKPTLAALEKLSNSIIPKPILRPNDRELGMFSLERAMMALEAELGLYDEKKDEWFPLLSGTPVLDKNGKQKTNEDGLLLYYLINTKRILVLKQLEEGGVKQWGSRNKKVFLAMEKVPRPKSAIRMFILIGNNAGSDTYWGGLTGIIAAQFLESKGYAVRITGVFGFSRGSGVYDKTTQQHDEGFRYNFVDLKKYDEPLNSLSLLYMVADPSFFRVRIFTIWYTEQWFNQDTAYYNIGSMPDIDDMTCHILEKIKEKEIEDEKDTLYYYFGGRRLRDIRAAKDQLIEMICDAETQNREMLIKLGYEFEPIDPSTRKAGDIDCPPPRQRNC